MSRKAYASVRRRCDGSAPNSRGGTRSERGRGGTRGVRRRRGGSRGGRAARRGSGGRGRLLRRPGGGAGGSAGLRVLRGLAAALPQGRRSRRPADRREGGRAREAHREGRPSREAGDGGGEPPARG